MRTRVKTTFLDKQMSDLISVEGVLESQVLPQWLILREKKYSHSSNTYK